MVKLSVVIGCIEAFPLLYSSIRWFKWAGLSSKGHWYLDIGSPGAARREMAVEDRHVNEPHIKEVNI